MPDRVLGVVLAGGEGRRLRPLTTVRCKPVVPFGRGHRIIDFALSNLRNSGLGEIHVLAEYQAHSLHEHLARAWPAGSPGVPVITVHEPRPVGGVASYRGTADALWQNRELIAGGRHDVVAILGSDHVYRMDLRGMLEFHRSHGSGVTLAATPVPLEHAAELGVLQVDAGGRVMACVEKPAAPERLAAGAASLFVSTGIWLIDPDALRDALAAGQGALDIAGDWSLVASLFTPGQVHAYDLRRNEPAGAVGRAAGYWRDVGTLPAYWQAHMDLLGPDALFEPDVPGWPLGGDGAAACPPETPHGVEILASPGATFAGSAVRRSVLGPGVHVEEGARVVDSVLLEGVHVGAGAAVERAIVDTPNHIPPGFRLASVVGGQPSGVRVLPCGLLVVAGGTFPERASRG